MEEKKVETNTQKIQKNIDHLKHICTTRDVKVHIINPNLIDNLSANLKAQNNDSTQKVKKSYTQFVDLYFEKDIRQKYFDYCKAVQINIFEEIQNKCSSDASKKKYVKILDELTSAIDDLNTADILKIAKKLKSMGLKQVGIDALVGLAGTILFMTVILAIAIIFTPATTSAVLLAMTLRAALLALIISPIFMFSKSTFSPSLFQNSKAVKILGEELKELEKNNTKTL